MAKKNKKKTVYEKVEELGSEIKSGLASGVERSVTRGWVDTYILEQMFMKEAVVPEEIEDALHDRLVYIMGQVEAAGSQTPLVSLASGSCELNSNDLLRLVQSIIDQKTHRTFLLGNVPTVNLGDFKVVVDNPQKASYSRINKKITIDAERFEEGEREFQVHPYSIVNWMSYFVSRYTIERFDISQTKGDHIVKVTGTADPIEVAAPLTALFTPPPVSDEDHVEYAILNHFTYSYLWDLVENGHIIHNEEFTSLLACILRCYDYGLGTFRTAFITKMDGHWHASTQSTKPSRDVMGVTQWADRKNLIRMLSGWGTRSKRETAVIKPDGHLWSVLISGE